MASKRILEKTQKEEKEDEDSHHDDKKPKLSDEQESDEKKESTDETKKDYDDEEGKDDPANEESTEQRIRHTVETARHEWLGQVERRHIRVGDAYQVTSLPVPGESNQEETNENGSNGKKKE